MAQRKAELYEVTFGKAGQNFEVDVVLGERPRILTQTKSLKPSRDVVRHGASLRQAGFAEAG